MQRSTVVIEELGHQQRFVAMNAVAADAQGFHEHVAVGAATEADEAFATT